MFSKCCSSHLYFENMPATTKLLQWLFLVVGATWSASLQSSSLSSTVTSSNQSNNFIICKCFTCLNNSVNLKVFSSTDTISRAKSIRLEEECFKFSVKSCVALFSFQRFGNDASMSPAITDRGRRKRIPSNRDVAQGFPQGNIRLLVQFYQLDETL